MSETTDPRYAAILAQQERDWLKCTSPAAQGNPFATLCYGCYGRHRPPLDEICPHRQAKEAANA